MTNELARLDAVSADGATTIVYQCKGSPDRQRVDLAGWIATGGALLAPLKDAAVFATVAVVDFGAAVGWADDDDLTIDVRHLFRLAEEQRPFGPADASAWQKGMAWSNQETADFLGLALSTWNAYKAGAPMPVSVGMLCRAVRRDPILAQAHYRPRKAGRPTSKLDMKPTPKTA